ncbi:MAG: P44/Msp2 family outer membrane protein [Anaplasma sp.]
MSWSAIRCFLAGVLCVLIGGDGATAASPTIGLEHWRLYEGVESRRAAGIYAGMGYAPSWGGVRNLKVEIPGETVHPVPLRRDAGSRDTRMLGGYDLGGQGEGQPGAIRFRRASTAGVTGFVGYGLGRNVRLELEGSWESWPVASMIGRTWRGGDAVFLLAAGYGPVGDPSSEGDSGVAREVVRILSEGDVLALKLHSMLYKARWKHIVGAYETYGRYGGRYYEEAYNSALVRAPGSAERVARDVDWLVRQYGVLRGSPSPRYYDFVLQALKRASASERRGFLDALAAVRGVVVEIPRVAATSLIASSCYDLMWGKVPVAPYGCLGMGVSFMEAAKGGGTKAEFACRAKLGLTYEITPQISLYGEALYHRAVNYDNQRVAVTTLEGSEEIFRDSRARVAFNLSYFAGGIGIRITS